MSHLLTTSFAIAVPFLLWPYFISRAFARLRVPSGVVVGALSGPFWFGWLLGLSVIVLPSGPLWLYAAISCAVPIVGVAAMRTLAVPFDSPEPRKAEQRSIPEKAYTYAFAALALGAVAILASYTLFIPARDHDILVIDAFAERLSNTWDYWGLPRYQPDDRGFYYPLAHPPAMMSVKAWLLSLSELEWLGRLASTWAFITICLGLFLAGSAAGVHAGFIALFLALSSPLFVKFITNNSQDVFRNAPLVLAVVVLSRFGSTRPIVTAAAAGALLGLSASYHSIGVLFAVLIPAGMVGVGLFYRPFRLAGLLAGVSAFAVGAYPYLSTMAEMGRVVIPTQSTFSIPNVIKASRAAGSTYSATLSDSADWFFARTSLISNLADWGNVGLAFILGLALVLLVRKFRLTVTPAFYAWLALVLVTCGYLYVVIDPGDLIYDFTGHRLQSNKRYPVAVLPLMVFSASWVFGAGLGRLRSWALASIVTGLLAYSALDTHAFDPDYQLYSEPNAACFFCDDETKLYVRKDSGMFRAVRWLDEKAPGRSCITFREGAYFAWSDLSGAPYYSTVADQVLGSDGLDSARQRLEGLGLDCIVIDGDSPIARNTERLFPAFWELRNADTTWLVSFADIEVWLFERSPVHYGAPVSSPPSSVEREGRKFIFDLPEHDTGELHLNLEAETPVTLIAYWEGADPSARSVIQYEFSGWLRVPTIGSSSVRLETSRPVSVTEAFFRPVFLDGGKKDDSTKRPLLPTTHRPTAPSGH